MKKLKTISAALAVIIAIAALLPLAGCEDKAEYTPALTLSASLPPEVAAEHSAFSANLYFVSEDGRRLAAEPRTITYALTESRAEAAVKELIKGPDTDKLSASIPISFILERVDISNESCSVYFKGQYPENDRAWLVARAALAQTICELEGVGSVSVFLNGSDPGYLGYELGALKPLNETLDVYIAAVRNEYESLAGILPAESGGSIVRTAAMYFTDDNGELLMARNVDLTYSPAIMRSELAVLLVNRLMEDPLGARISDSALPEGLELMEPPKVTYIATGKQVDESDPPEDGDLSCVIELAFPRPPEGTDIDILCGALTMTLTGYMTNVTGVSIRLMDDAENGGDGSYFTRTDFQNMLGRSVYVLFPDADGSVLHRVAHSLPSRSVNDPYYRLRELFDIPSYPGEQYPLFTGDDIKRVYITDDIAVVDWKAGFTEKFKAMLDEDSTLIPRNRLERLFVYSVVNTLCELTDVKRVWMLEDGEKLGLMENIYLGNALMENPGLVLDE